MNDTKHQIRVWANNATGKRVRFTKEMFFPCFVPIGYDITFMEFSIRVREAVIHNGYVIIRGSMNAEYDAGELLREGVCRGVK